MRRGRRIFERRAVWLLLVVCVLVAAAMADRRIGLRPVNGQHPDVITWQNEKLTSLLVANDFVYATNRWGMFRASRTDRRWTPVQLPDTVPAVGGLVEAPAESRVIYYVVPWAGAGVRRECDGLYSSDDGGETWQHVSARRDLREIRLTHNGDLYAEASTPAGSGGETLELLQSRDGGRHWNEVFTDHVAARVVWLISLDEDDPDAVEVRVVNFAAPATTKKTYITRSGGRWVQSDAARKSRQFPFFNDAPERGAFTPAEWINATLGNYFPLGFRGRMWRHALRLATDAEAYSFRHDGPKPVWVSVFNDSPSIGPLLIYDNPRWGGAFEVNARLPDGRVIRAHMGSVSGDIGLMLGWRRKPEPNPTAIAVSSTQPFRRQLDLAEVMPFPLLGKYEVQISTYPALWSNVTFNPNAGLRGAEAELFTSVFTVTIHPD